jgi:hypothetical protein
MPEEFRQQDTVVAYRQYYAKDKRKMLSYKNRPIPAFLGLTGDLQEHYRVQLQQASVN